jgi:hypothetical protein
LANARGHLLNEAIVARGGSFESGQSSIYPHISSDIIVVI